MHWQRNRRRQRRARLEASLQELEASTAEAEAEHQHLLALVMANDCHDSPSAGLSGLYSDFNRLHNENLRLKYAIYDEILRLGHQFGAGGLTFRNSATDRFAFSQLSTGHTFPTAAPGLVPSTSIAPSSTAPSRPMVVDPRAQSSHSYHQLPYSSVTPNTPDPRMPTQPFLWSARL